MRIGSRHHDDQRLAHRISNNTVGNNTVGDKNSHRIPPGWLFKIPRITQGFGSNALQLFRRTQQVFPPSEISKNSTFQHRTLRHGVHMFPFSIGFPQVSECYKEEMNDGQSLEGCGGRRPRNRKNKTLHLLRRLPPSMGNEATAGEIVYSLNAVVHRNGFIDAPLKASRKIFLSPVSAFVPPVNSVTAQRCLVDIESNNVQVPNSTTYQVDIKLASSGCIFLGRPIPLKVYITRMKGIECEVFLNDYQSMLIETTNIQALGHFETRKHCQVIQTVSNMGQSVSPRNTPIQSSLCIHDDLWKAHRLPYNLTPTFETCNISRNYKLEIRLGLQFEMPHTQTRIIETQFPVYILNPRPHGRNLSTSDLPGYYDEKEVLNYGMGGASN
ncbi:hypothetical protein FE257_001274 [Aspergillus nanangensis]|uniref:Arrestin-like N-terminal domain-containing protein n=1 Tax=Aspergillus nanangensis TaxID=2582783 RepID=A0AAD4CE37_ASPNN|nr:hypothetical protein FE257_001274 [Aspergillus nanangensis]